MTSLDEDQTLRRPEPGSDDPRDEAFPNEPTPDQPVLPLPGEDPGDVERAGFGDRRN